MTETQQVDSISHDIERLVFKNQPARADVERKTIIDKDDIISLTEAKKSTGFLDVLGHNIKKFVWA